MSGFDPAESAEGTAELSRGGVRLRGLPLQDHSSGHVEMPPASGGRSPQGRRSTAGTGLALAASGAAVAARHSPAAWPRAQDTALVPVLSAQDRPAPVGVEDTAVFPALSAPDVPACGARRQWRRRGLWVLAVAVAGAVTGAGLAWSLHDAHRPIPSTAVPGPATPSARASAQAPEPSAEPSSTPQQPDQATVGPPRADDTPEPATRLLPDGLGAGLHIVCERYGICA